MRQQKAVEEVLGEDEEKRRREAFRAEQERKRREVIERKKRQQQQQQQHQQQQQQQQQKCQEAYLGEEEYYCIEQRKVPPPVPSLSLRQPPHQQKREHYRVEEQDERKDNGWGQEFEDNPSQNVPVPPSRALKPEYNKQHAVHSAPSPSYHQPMSPQPTPHRSQILNLNSKGPPMGHAGERRTKSTEVLPMSKGSSARNLLGKLSPRSRPTSDKDVKPSAAMDCLSVLKDPTKRTQFQAFVTERGGRYGYVMRFWTMVDEFVHAPVAVRAALATAIHKEFIRDGAPFFDGFPASQRLRREMANEFEQEGADQISHTFYDEAQKEAFWIIENELFPSWQSSSYSASSSPSTKKSQSPGGVSPRSPRHHGAVSIGAPVLTSGNTAKYKPVPLREAQSQLPQVPSRDKQRSASFSDRSSHHLSPMVAPRSKSKEGSPRKMERKSPPPPINRNYSPKFAPNPENIINDSLRSAEWDKRSIHSDLCTYDWSYLCGSNTRPIDTVKCILVGDERVGKTQLGRTLLNADFDR